VILLTIVLAPLLENEDEMTAYSPPIAYSSTELKRVDVIEDLGVVFDSDLTFVSHSKQNINKTY